MENSLPLTRWASRTRTFSRVLLWMSKRAARRPCWSLKCVLRAEIERDHAVFEVLELDVGNMSIRQFIAELRSLAMR